MNNILTDAYMHPTARRNLQLLRDVKWKENKNELSNIDEHIIRVYSLQTKMEYNALKKICSECKKENFELEFLQKLVKPNEELKEVMTCKLLKKSEQFGTAQMLLHNNNCSADKFVTYLLKKTNILNEVNEKINSSRHQNFYLITNISKDNKLGKYLKQQIELENKINNSIGRVK